MKRSILIAVLLCIHLLLFVKVSRAAQPAAKKARPASSYKLTNDSQIEVESHNSYYIRAMGATDLGLGKTYGGGLAFGYMFDSLYLGVSGDYISASYESLLVHQEGVKKQYSVNDDLTTDTSAPLDSEVYRNRNRADTSTLLLVGPEVGYHFKVFRSEHIVESARFRLAYASWSDQTNILKFTGVGATMTGSIGYMSKSFLIAPAVGWNLVYLTRSDNRNGAGTNDGVKSHDYLSLQLWTAQLDATFFL